MKKSSPPKHKTPNYRQVRHSRLDWMGRRTYFWLWEPAPLRTTRKDLAT